MKLYKRFLTGIAALGLLFSGLMGCESPTNGEPGPDGRSVPRGWLTIESTDTIVGAGSKNVTFKAMFKGDDVTSNVATKWEVTGDGIDPTGLDTNYAKWGRDGNTLINAAASPAVLTVDRAEKAKTLKITASHGGYNAEYTLEMGAGGLKGIRLIPGAAAATTRIELWRQFNNFTGGSAGIEDGEPYSALTPEQVTILNAPLFGYYYVYGVSEKKVQNVPAGYRLEDQSSIYTVNEDTDIPVRNGDYVTIYEVPQDQLTNTEVHAYVSYQIHTSARDDLKFADGTINLYQPTEFGRPEITAADAPAPAAAEILNTVVDLVKPGTGLKNATLVYGVDTALLADYTMWVIDEAAWNGTTPQGTPVLDKDAALDPQLPSTARQIPAGATEIELPTVGTWRLVVKHTASGGRGAWWDIDTAQVAHNAYARGWDHQKAENILHITTSNGKNLIDYRGITLNGIPITIDGLRSTWSTGNTGNSYVELYLGALDMTASAATPGTSPEASFVTGAGPGVVVGIPAENFVQTGCAPVTPPDPDITVRWSVYPAILGKVDVRGVKQDDDENSVIKVINRYTQAEITEHYYIEWFYVEGPTWTPTGKTGATFEPAHDEGSKGLYLGLKISPLAGYEVEGDSEFVFPRFTD